MSLLAANGVQVRLDHGIYDVTFGPLELFEHPHVRIKFDEGRGHLIIRVEPGTHGLRFVVLSLHQRLVCVSAMNIMSDGLPGAARLPQTVAHFRDRDCRAKKHTTGRSGNWQYMYLPCLVVDAGLLGWVVVVGVDSAGRQVRPAVGYSLDDGLGRHVQVQGHVDRQVALQLLGLRRGPREPIQQLW